MKKGMGDRGHPLAGKGVSLSLRVWPGRVLCPVTLHTVEPEIQLWVRRAPMGKQAVENVGRPSWALWGLFPGCF